MLTFFQPIDLGRNNSWRLRSCKPRTKRPIPARKARAWVRLRAFLQTRRCWRWSGGKPSVRNSSRTPLVMNVQLFNWLRTFVLVTQRFHIRWSAWGSPSWSWSQLSWPECRQAGLMRWQARLRWEFVGRLCSSTKMSLATSKKASPLARLVDGVCVLCVKIFQWERWRRWQNSLFVCSYKQANKTMNIETSSKEQLNESAQSTITWKL